MNPARLGEIREIVNFKMLVGHGGVPIVRDGMVVGAVGVHGGGPEISHELATLAATMDVAELAGAR